MAKTKAKTMPKTARVIMPQVSPAVGGKARCKAQVWVTSSFIGFHRWDDAPPEVVYLRDLHRHKFNVRVKVSVDHSNREVEFHILKDALECALEVVLRDLVASPGMSCETLALRIAECMSFQGYYCSAVQVDEDGECGAEVYP